MIHCKHSRIAKSADEPPQSHREADPWRATGRLSNPRFWWRIPSEGLHTVEGEVGQLENHATRDGVCPARHSSPLRLMDSFLLFCYWWWWLRYSLSILNVSSVAGSASTMSGSLSMCSPSRVSGSIFSSSRGNCVSASKLTSPTPANELVSSLERLGGDSPVTERCDIRERRETHAVRGGCEHTRVSKS